jgi:hypothetical protein
VVPASDTACGEYVVGRPMMLKLSVIVWSENITPLLERLDFLEISIERQESYIHAFFIQVIAFFSYSRSRQIVSVAKDTGIGYGR